MPFEPLQRRQVLSLIGGAAAAAAPLPARAQPRARIPQLGILLYSTPKADPQMEPARHGLRDLGYIEGKNLAITYRYAEGRPERLIELAAELARAKPDVILSLGGEVSAIAARSTKTIPVVFTSSADPVQLGFVASLARPGGNATGVTFLLDDTASKRLELLKEAAPRVSRVAIVLNPDHFDNELQEAERAAPTLGLQILRLDLRTSDDIEPALRAAADARADAIYVVSSRMTLRNLQRLVDFATANRLPLAGGFGDWAQAGGLLSYGPNVGDMARRAVTYVDRIFKGAKPSDLPVQQPTRFELVVNLKTAKAIGLTISEAFLARADEVIE
jgi:putative ABC transport system substrate-binding protein